MKRAKNHLNIFIKYPATGKVKTRLAKEIGDELALKFYKNSVEYLVKTLDSASFTTNLFIDPFIKKNDFQAWLGTHNFFPQKGKDLGERMANCMKTSFEAGAEKTVIIGSDIPEITIKTALDSFKDLSQSKIVIAPSGDGGYSLIGLTSLAAITIFKDINWSTNSVFDETLLRIRELDIKSHILPTLEDIDLYEDLEKFFKKEPNHPCFKGVTPLFKDLLI